MARKHFEREPDTDESVAKSKATEHEEGAPCWTPERVARAIEEGGELGSALALEITPVIRARVARRLRRSGIMSQCGESRYETEDLCQDVLTRLLERGGRLLRQWDPERGLSLRNFVGLIADRFVGGILRYKGARKESAMEPGALYDTPCPVPHPAIVAEQREMLEVLRRLLAGRISERGMAVYQLLFVQQQSVLAVADRMGLREGAIYSWRSRIRKQLRLISVQLMLVDQEDRARDARVPEAA
jgi:RNA polymerase sigma-70 factor (ECF subfamily)